MRKTWTPEQLAAELQFAAQFAQVRLSGRDVPRRRGRTFEHAPDYRAAIASVLEYYHFF
jgi:hypothetical protein